MNFVRLKNYSNAKTEKLKSILMNINLKNIFNPCYKEFKKYHYISFRADSEVRDALAVSYLLCLDENYLIIYLINISTLYLNKYGIQRVHEPKLFVLNQSIFMSFNTGPSINGNEFYLAKINNDFPQPKKCIYEKRMLMEKNWAFYNFDNKLFAIYSLSPLITLEAVSIEKDKIIFKDISDLRSDFKFFKGFSIGSDIQKVDDKYFLMAHEKKFLHTKRIYFGKLVCLSFVNDKFKISKIYPYRYIHSFRSLFGTFKKRNINLISCSYFSGILYCEKDEKILISYGINDFSFSFASIPLNSLI